MSMYIKVNIAGPISDHLMSLAIEVPDLWLLIGCFHLEIGENVFECTSKFKPKLMMSCFEH